jgi:hypothetical protein
VIIPKNFLVSVDFRLNPFFVERIGQFVLAFRVFLVKHLFGCF